MAGRSVSEIIDLLCRHCIPVVRSTAKEQERELADFG